MLVSSSGNQIINTTTTSPNHNNHHHHHATSSSSSPPSSSAPNSSSADPPITLITSTNGNNTTPTNNKRKRRPAGTPDPDAEVVSLSPKTLLESDRYVCEICNQGFQRDQNLQMHRRRHKVPWKLLKRDNTSGSQTATRKRVFVCPEPTCLHHDPTHALGDLVGIKKHFRRKHSNHKQWVCGRCSKAYAVQSDYKAHLKTCGTRGHSCDCGRVFSRVESFIEHQDACHMGRLRPDHHHHHPHQSPGTANANANANAAPPLSTTTLHQQQHPPPPSSSSVCLSRTGSSPSPSHDNTIPPLYWPPPPPQQQQQQQQPPCTLPVLHHITAASPPNNLSTNNSTNTSYQNNNNNIIVNDDVDRTTTLRNTLRPDQITTISVHNLELQLLTSCTTAPTPSIINHNQTPTQQQHHLSPVSKTPPNHLPYSTSTHLQLSIGSSSDTTTGDKHHNDHLSTETSVSDKKPDDHSTATVLLGTGIKEEACEQLRLAMAEKAYAEEARREAKRQVEIAEREFSNAKRIRQRAQAELDKANTLKEQAVRQISDTLLQITCHACKQQFDQEVVLLRSGILHHQQLEEGNHEE